MSTDRFFTVGPGPEVKKFADLEDASMAARVANALEGDPNWWVAGLDSNGVQIYGIPFGNTWVGQSAHPEWVEDAVKAASSI